MACVHKFYTIAHCEFYSGSDKENKSYYPFDIKSRHLFRLHYSVMERRNILLCVPKNTLNKITLSSFLTVELLRNISYLLLVYFTLCIMDLQLLFYFFYFTTMLFINYTYFFIKGRLHGVGST